MLISVEPLYNFVREIYTVFYIPLLAPVYIFLAVTRCAKIRIGKNSETRQRCIIR